MNRLGNGNNAEAAGRTDAELVQASRRGDKRAFVEIVARHQAMVCGIALGILGDFAASEDAGQETFLTAWRKIHELRAPERLRFWLAQIARNAALGHLRKKRGDAALEDAEILADESPAPDEAAATEEEAELVRDSLAKLPELYRLPLILFYREGQSVRAVAETLAISEDAVKQRLARGREMLRDRMSGLIETVLTRSTPTAVFTMAIAVAIGALAAPAAVAASAFAATSTSTPLLTAMSISKTILATAAVLTAVCIPVGYYVSHHQSSSSSSLFLDSSTTPTSRPPPSFQTTALFREWQELHDKHGRTADAMPVIYKVIADMKDTFRRRAFRAALIAEWVQLDPNGAFAFLRERQSDSEQRRQFFEEWLAHDARAAVDAVLASGSGWESMARENLSEIARRVPARLPEVASRLPKSERFYDRQISDAFTILAENDLASARKAAERVSGANREQAFAGVAGVWARGDLQGALAWAKTLPAGTDRDEVIRGALMGRASVDPVGALELVGIVPPGGRHAHGNSTTAERVVHEAAKADFDATVAWLAANPGRVGGDGLDGLSTAVTDRLNADTVRFLTQHAAAGTLNALLPAIESALLNSASGQRPVVWDWLKTQPKNEATKALQDRVLRAAGYQDPAHALRLVGDLPRTPEGEAQLESIASSLLNGGSAMYRLDKLLREAPERLRQPLIDNAFKNLRADTLDNPQLWVARLSLLPESARDRGIESIARAWAEQRPEEAITWVASLPAGDTRSSAVAAIASAWARQDPPGAGEWLNAMSPGPERDRSAASFVAAVAERFPREAWDWTLSIDDPAQRNGAATQAIRAMAARDAATARQWIEIGPFTPETRAELRKTIDKTVQ